MSNETVVQAACHCKTVRFEVQLSDGLKTARRCTCSMCRMRGAVAVSAELDGVRIVSGEDALKEYRFSTGTAKHYFCSVCGIYTHHQRRSNPRQFGVNAACLEGVSPFDFREVRVNDGVHHPSDLGPGAKPRLAGILRFDPSGDGEAPDKTLNGLDTVAFGGSPETSDTLLALVLEGKKTATCWAARHGQLSYVGKRVAACDGAGRLRAVLETTSVDIRRFCDVDGAWARLEGEGDLSLSWWRQTHRAFFEAEGEFSEDMELWCERFRVLEVLP